MFCVGCALEGGGLCGEESWRHKETAGGDGRWRHKVASYLEDSRVITDPEEIGEALKQYFQSWFWRT